MHFSENRYIIAPPLYSRFPTREVKAGDVGIGGKNPIRVQSMTNTNTLDTKATVEQSIRMIAAGCELVRVTTPGMNEAENLLEIKKELRRRGYKQALIADVHFNPKIAEFLAPHVEKIRINPGNYADRRTPGELLSAKEYASELQRIRERLLPLLKRCRQYGTAIRIGTNHGSLSGRIMQRYGNTVTGMVASAMEFLQICAGENFHHIVMSMKSSNLRITIQAYRMLVAEMMKEGMNYPLHLGVTEAGVGLQGRLKSAGGIGVLLEEGIGDTIRVSLTEAPEYEIPVAKILAMRPREGGGSLCEKISLPFNPFQYNRRISRQIGAIGNGQAPVVVGEAVKNPPQTKYIPDYIYLNGLLRKTATNEDSLKTIIIHSHSELHETVGSKKEFHDTVVILESSSRNSILSIRCLVLALLRYDPQLPVILARNFSEEDVAAFPLYAASDMNALLVDGLIDGIWIKHQKINTEELYRISYGILQASRDRITQTEFVSCPSCGRTKFDIEKALKEVAKALGHIKGLKIAVMGCIVNGPGEMADADYGYIGAGEGKVCLYKAGRMVYKNVPEEEALEKLLGVIRKDGHLEPL